MRKLTLSADDEVIEQAKRLADRHKTSVSAMFSRFVRGLAQRDQASSGVPSDSIAARAAGAIRLPKGKTAQDVLAEALIEKHGTHK